MRRLLCGSTPWVPGGCAGGWGIPRQPTARTARRSRRASDVRSPFRREELVSWAFSLGVRSRIRRKGTVIGQSHRSAPFRVVPSAPFPPHLRAMFSSRRFASFSSRRFASFFSRRSASFSPRRFASFPNRPVPSGFHGQNSSFVGKSCFRDFVQCVRIFSILSSCSGEKRRLIKLFCSNGRYLYSGRTKRGSAGRAG